MQARHSITNLNPQPPFLLFMSNADFYETFVPETKQHRQMEGCAFTTGTAGSEPLKWSCRKPGRQERVPLGDESHKVTSETIPSVTEGLHNTLQQL